MPRENTAKITDPIWDSRNSDEESFEKTSLLITEVDGKKYIPFTVICPEIKPGQGLMTREISIEITEKHGEYVITPESMDRIDTHKMQMMLSRLTECVKELYTKQ